MTNWQKSICFILQIYDLKPYITTQPYLVFFGEYMTYSIEYWVGGNNTYLISTIAYIQRIENV